MPATPVKYVVVGEMPRSVRFDTLKIHFSLDSKNRLLVEFDKIIFFSKRNSRRFFVISFSFYDVELGVDPERFVPPHDCEEE